MDWTITWLDSTEYVQANMAGAFKLADARSAISDIVDDPEWNNGDKLLVGAHVDVDNINLSDIEAMSEMMGRLDEKIGMSRIAIVGPTDLQFGLSRQFQMNAASHTTADVMAFRSEAAAVKWLKTGLLAMSASPNSNFSDLG